VSPCLTGLLGTSMVGRSASRIGSAWTWVVASPRVLARQDLVGRSASRTRSAGTWMVGLPRGLTRHGPR
jgi:hypothetical protein